MAAVEAPQESITDEQANEALRKLVEVASLDDDDDNLSPEQLQSLQQQPPQPDEQPAEQPPEAAKAPDGTADESAGATEAAAESTETAAEVAEESDDVASLKQRTKQLEDRIAEAEKRAEARIAAIRQRDQQSSQILRDRLLRKSTVADKALRILRQSRSADGVPEADVDRLISEIEGSMNPQSANYTPPEQYQQHQQQTGGGASTEDQVLVLNDFFNERGMTDEESKEFGKWIRDEAATQMSPLEQRIAQESLNGFLHLAHSRWNEVKQRKADETKADVIGAVRGVQHTQREVARAASAAVPAPRKQSVSPRQEGIDVNKLTDAQVAELIRRSTQQYLD